MNQNLSANEKLTHGVSGGCKLQFHGVKFQIELKDSDIMMRVNRPVCVFAEVTIRVIATEREIEHQIWNDYLFRRIFINLQIVVVAIKFPGARSGVSDPAEACHGNVSRKYFDPVLKHVTTDLLCYGMARTVKNVSCIIRICVTYPLTSTRLENKECMTIYTLVESRHGPCPPTDYGPMRYSTAECISDEFSLEVQPSNSITHHFKTFEMSSLL